MLIVFSEVVPSVVHDRQQQVMEANAISSGGHTKYFKGENFHRFRGFLNNLENFSLENFVLHSRLSFYNP